MLDAFLPNLLVFLLGQAAAIGYLMTGRNVPGIAIVVATWVFADAALVTRFGFGHDGSWFWASLILMQLTCLGAAGWFGYERWRRSRPDTRASRDQLRHQWLQQYLRNQLEDAAETARQLVRSDPWDGVGYLTSAMALGRSGDPARARRDLNRARRLDREGRYEDVITHEVRRLDSDVVVRSRSTVVRTSNEKGGRKRRGASAS